MIIDQTDSLKLEHIESHQQNPVIVDARVARGGGPIFKQNNETFRPSQNNSNGVYGYGLNLNRIKKLSIDE